MAAIELDETLSNSIGLLKDIIQLWITIRGFAYAGALVDQYKRQSGTLKQKKALRKDLKRKCLATEFTD